MVRRGRREALSGGGLRAFGRPSLRGEVTRAVCIYVVHREQTRDERAYGSLGGWRGGGAAALSAGLPAGKCLPPASLRRWVAVSALGAGSLRGWVRWAHLAQRKGFFAARGRMRGRRSGGLGSSAILLYLHCEGAGEALLKDA